MSRLLRIVVLGCAAVGAGFYVIFFARIVAAGEVFHRLGFDWTMFWAQAMVLRNGGREAIYDLASMNTYLVQLAAYYGGRVSFEIAQPVPYPPWFAALMVPFTVPPPPIGLALWYGVSILALLYLAHRVLEFLPKFGFFGGTVLILAAIPVATDLYTGQVALLLAIPVGEMLISFKARQDFRAGLWLAVLLVKPQYAVLFGIFVLWKLRRQAIGGAIVGTLGFVVLGLLTAGVGAFLELPRAVLSMADSQDGLGAPWLMINWRAIVPAMNLPITNQASILVVAVLSVLTMGVALFPWRGNWKPDAPEFAPRFCLLTFGALISSYQSHLHGAALLIIPVAAAWGMRTFQLPTRVAIAAALYLPTFILVWTAAIVRGFVVPSNIDVQLWYVWPSEQPAILFALACALMTFDLSGVRISNVLASAAWLWSQLSRIRHGRLIVAGATGIVVLGVVLTNVVIPRVRARPPRSDVFASQNLTMAPVVKGLTQPTSVVAPPDDSNRLFIVQRGGLVRVADAAGQLNATPFLDLSEQVSSGTEQGVLGLAFHPRFTQNHNAYVSYTALDWSVQVVRYTVSADHPDIADLSTAQTVLVVPKRSKTHNAGMLAFGPDGFLYVGIGDDEASESSQDLSSLTGKILRLDVDAGAPYVIPPSNPFVEGDARGEIWAYGLRNPLRFSFDRATGDLWIGDVHHVDGGESQENNRESVELQPAGSHGGENFGFPARLFHCADVTDCRAAGVTPPVAQYDHNMNCSVTGGYVYRGKSVPSLSGAYIFGDYCTGGVFAVRGNANEGWSPRLELGFQPIKISAFGEDAAGELYVVDIQGGTIYRMTDGRLP